MDLDERALTAAHRAVEDVLIDFRDRHVSMFLAANGFVVRERDGSDSSIIRLGTREGLGIGIEAYLNAMAEDDQSREG